MRHIVSAATALVVAATAAAAAAAASGAHAGSSPDRVHLDDIKTLTFFRDRMTTGRREPPVPQLTCIGSLCKWYTPPTVQCEHRGNAQWKCEAELPVWAQFGPLQVSCEGWSHKHDADVVRGSCALRFELVSPNTHAQSSWATWLFFFFFFAITAAIVISFLESCCTRRADSDDPPPYSPAPAPAQAPAEKSRSWLAGGLAAVGLTSLAASVQQQRRTQPYPAYAPYPAYGAIYNPALDSAHYGLGSHGGGGGASSSTHTSTGFGDTDNR